MRLGATHLAYCTNVHPGEDLEGILAQLDRFAVPVREELNVDVLGLGLWLAAPVAAELAADAGLCRRLRHELHSRGLETVTLNGFPYQAFHDPVVKHAVYSPDWTDPRRLRYTLDLAHVLAQLLPDDAPRGSISTLPLAWREPWDSHRLGAAHRMLDHLAAVLALLPRPIRVAIEPEPGCVIETTDQAIVALSGVDTDHLGVCLDLAHVAVAWEEPSAALSKLDAAGIPVVKAQISAALQIDDPAAAAGVLSEYAEPRFLHQTRNARGASFDDLPQALAAAPDGPWRVHFHTPLHASPAAPLRHTDHVVRDGLAALVAAGCDHLEVETYTWQVLPASQRPHDDAGLAKGIAAELRYVIDHLRKLGVS